jgi:hypothetical protein
MMCSLESFLCYLVLDCCPGPESIALLIEISPKPMQAEDEPREQGWTHSALRPHATPRRRWKISIVASWAWVSSSILQLREDGNTRGKS